MEMYIRIVCSDILAALLNFPYGASAQQLEAIVLPTKPEVFPACLELVLNLEDRDGGKLVKLVDNLYLPCPNLGDVKLPDALKKLGGEGAARHA